MYELFYEFNDRPFAASPLVENYFPAESIEQARQTLIRVVERAEGPGLVIGQAGLGKSLLCRLIAEYFSATFDVVLLSSARIGTRKSLLQSILFELKLPYRELEEGELRLGLLDFLQPGNSSPNGMLLVVDEAHTLPLRLLDEIRMITNLVRDGQPRARLVMAGNPQLEERFAHPKLDSFNQRIAARCYLECLSRDDTYRYVKAQIGAVGGDPKSVFSEEAMAAVHQASNGIPRLINQICDHTLVLGCAGGKRELDSLGVEEAWADLQQLPGPWRDVPGDESSESIVEFGELDDFSPLSLDFDSSEPVDASTEDDVDESSTKDSSTGMEFPTTSALDLDEHGLEEQRLEEEEQVLAEEPNVAELESLDAPEVAAPHSREAIEPAEEAPFGFPQVIIGQQFDYGASVEFGTSDLDRIEIANDESDEDRVIYLPPTTDEEVEPTSAVEEEEEEEEVAVAADPFAAEYEDEEVIINRDEALAIEAFRGRPSVTSSEGRELADLLSQQIGRSLDEARETTPPLSPSPAPVAEPSLAYQTDDLKPTNSVESEMPAENPAADWPQPAIALAAEGEVSCVAFPEPSEVVEDDRELMIIQDAPEETETPLETTKPRRVEYQQLFAQLRKA